MHFTSNKLIYLVIVFSLLMITSETGSSLNINFEFVSHFGGLISDVVVAENYTYIGQGQDFVVLNTSNITDPSPAGRLNTFSLIKEIEISGNYAYLTDFENSLLIVNITHHSSPTLESRFNLTGNLTNLAVTGNYAYIVKENNSLLMVDISDPRSPALVEVYSNPYITSISDLDVAGNYTYLLDRNNGLFIVDITNPRYKKLINMYDNVNKSKDLGVWGNYAYLINESGFLEILDISDPFNIALAGSYDVGILPYSFTVEEKYAYVTSLSGLFIVDINDPSSPALKGIYNSQGAKRIDIEDNYAYLISDNSLMIVDITEPSYPIIGGRYDSVGKVDSVSVKDNYAYLAKGDEGLLIVDLNDLSVPKIAHICDFDNYIYNVYLVDNYAYATYENGLALVNITDPHEPEIVSTLNISANISDVVIAGNYAYVMDKNTGLAILDISVPSSPSLISNYKSSDYTKNVAVAGNYAYISHENNNSIEILNISVPSSPVFENIYMTPGSVYGIAVAGDYAYLASGEKGLAILNISNPSSPKLMNIYSTDFASDVTIEGNYAYVIDTEKGVVTLDITNPSSPIIAGMYKTGGGIKSIATSGNYVYIADMNNGLVIICMQTEPDRIPPASVTDLKGNSIGPTWINWTWNNPDDADFSHVMIYIDGTFITNTSDVFYNLTGISERSTHTISTKSVDFSGNINTTWINNSATTYSINTGGSGRIETLEDIANLELKDVDTQYLGINSFVTYEFTRAGDFIDSVSFFSLRNTGRIKSTIEILKDRSKLVKINPEGVVYKYFNIWVGDQGFSSPANIADPKINFKVDRSWLQQMRVSPENVKLQMYNGVTWEVMPTTVKGSDDSYIFFEAYPFGFSTFAITAQTTLKSTLEDDMPIQTKSDNIESRPQTSNPWTTIVSIFLITAIGAGYLFLKKEKD